MKLRIDTGGLISTVLVAAILFGYVRCVVKFVSCDFKEPYKAEMLYGIGALTGLGIIIGYTNIGE